MLAINTVWSNAKVLSTWVGQIRERTTAHQILLAKLSEAFIISTEQISSQGPSLAWL